MLSIPASNSPFGEIDFHTNSIPHARICALSIEHDDLDSAIDALVKTNMHDDLIVARLKKRRLQIRDEIAGLVAAAQRRDAHDAETGAPIQSGADIDASGPQTGSVAAAPGGSFVFGALMTLSFLLLLALGWSGAEDSLNQTIAQIALLSLLVAAHG